MKIKFVKQDCWIGLYWKTLVPEPTCHCGDPIAGHAYTSGHTPTEMTQPKQTTWYLCIVPCFPIIWQTETRRAPKSESEKVNEFVKEFTGHYECKTPDRKTTMSEGSPEYCPNCQSARQGLEHMNTPTPETDAFILKNHKCELGTLGLVIFARKLERQRDEARKVEACVILPNVASYIYQIETERDRLRKMLAKCLDALNQEAIAADHWAREAEKCAAWYQIRAEAREILGIPDSHKHSSIPPVTDIPEENDFYSKIEDNLARGLNADGSKRKKTK
jgi:hypothetical protein